MGKSLNIETLLEQILSNSRKTAIEVSMMEEDTQHKHIPKHVSEKKNFCCKEVPVIWELRFNKLAEKG